MSYEQIGGTANSDFQGAIRGKRPQRVVAILAEALLGHNDKKAVIHSRDKRRSWVFHTIHKLRKRFIAL